MSKQERDFGDGIVSADLPEVCANELCKVPFPHAPHSVILRPAKHPDDEQSDECPPHDFDLLRRCRKCGLGSARTPDDAAQGIGDGTERGAS